MGNTINAKILAKVCSFLPTLLNALEIYHQNLAYSSQPLAKKRNKQLIFINLFFQPPFFPPQFPVGLARIFLEHLIEFNVEFWGGGEEKMGKFITF